ncbi:MAG TPA: hypothetical protein VL131_12945 [Gammaproteobacteria bacterium]|nr:hypothetical protein [Gammaproteobacteria bacterium]
MARETASERDAIGVALSGGGHRATAYALGVLVYLVDSGLNTRVRTVASVSGGSILNAFIAVLRSHDGTARSFRSFAGFGSFDAEASRLASLLAGSRIAWFATVAAAALVEVAIVVLFLAGAIHLSTALLVLATALVALSVGSGPRSGGSLWGWWGTWIYCSGIAWLGSAVAMGVGATRFKGIWLAIGIALCGWLVQQRHVVAEHAYDRTVCRPPLPPHRRWWARRMRLEDMDADVRHVFCATEMHSGRHAYFSHDVVYARGFGLGSPAGLPIATAVQASANFPGGFPIRPLRASRFGFSLTDRFEEAVEQGIKQGRDILTTAPDLVEASAANRFVPIRPLPRWLMLSDGGVFDNLAVDWFVDSEQRRRRFLMRLNWDWDPESSWWHEHGTNTRDEAILDRLRDSSGCMIVVNAGITSHWQRTSSAQISVPLIGEVIGLSQISSTMYNNYTKERVRAVADHVVVELAGLQRVVPTTLLPLGRKVTADLLRAGYHDANEVAYRRFSHPYLQTSYRSEDFEALASGRAPPRARDVMDVVAPSSSTEAPV